jgi:hypothetical protein
MSTEQPTNPSPSAPASKTEAAPVEYAAETAQLKQMHEILRSFMVDPEALAVLFVGPSEMVIGEVVDHELFTGTEGGHGSILRQNDGVILIHNPRRLTRHTLVDRASNQINNQMVFSDFDFIHVGLVEVRANVAFFLDWCDVITQLQYCGSYANFLEGRRRAQAQAAGIVLPDEQGPQPDKRILDLKKRR